MMHVRGILAVVSLLSMLTLPSCGRSQTTSPGNGAAATGSTAASAPATGSSTPTAGTTTPSLAEPTAPTATQPASATWPAMVGDEDSVLAVGIAGKILDKMPPSLALRDVMIQPGETADVAITLARGFGSTSLKTYGGQTIIVSDAAGTEVLREKADDKGTIRFTRKFAEPGNYFYRASVDGPVEEKTVRPVLFGIYVRPKDTPIVLCDMDKTLVQSGFAQVLAGLAKPFDGAAAVMHRLVKERGLTVVYLTHRHDFLDVESRTWLRKYDFPPGPLVGSDLGGLFAGSEKFKTGAIAELKKRYANLKMAIGDKIADANAYVANQVPNILLPDIEWDKDKPKYWREKLAEIQTVDPSVTVCRDWTEIERALFQNTKYPLNRMVDLVRAATVKSEKDD